MGRKYADIIVDISQEKLDRTFQYEIPQHLADEVGIGSRVKIPFGKGTRTITGYVVGISNRPKIEPFRIKEILEPEKKGISMESRLISLASWMAEQYGSTMNQALKMVLPVKEKINSKEECLVFLQISPEKAGELQAEWERKHFAAKARLLEALQKESPLSASYLSQALKIQNKALRKLEEQGIIKLETKTVYRNPVMDAVQKPEQKHLSEVQREAAEQILEEWRQKAPRPCLIHGVTGSGKTEIYMELMEEVLKQGKQVIVLIPEIALTYQTVERFGRRFGSGVSFMHSRLSAGERYDLFEQAKNGRISIVVGPRSALFLPFPRLGLIVIDEEQEASYRSEKSPCYHAREAAVYRAEMEGAHVVMGSATPSMESYTKGKAGEYLLLQIQSRYAGRELPAVCNINMKEEMKLGNRSIFSGLLQEKIRERLERKEQVMLFLNRRGYSGFVSCRACGHVMKCPHCDVSLTSHRNGKLICHYCGYERADVEQCPVCSSPYIGGFKAGTQQIEEQVKRRFPEAKVLRMDADTTRKKDDHEKILASFARGEASILVGTQMIVKGHDFPLVTLVGVLAADLSLNVEDYRAGERTFQLLTQAVGRAGRGVRPGEAVIQSYQPEHYCISAAAKQDYEAFYKEEIAYRSLMGYPPVKAMAAVRGFCEDEALLKQGLEYCKKYIRKIYPKKDLLLIGPAPGSISKVQDSYRMVLYMRHQNREVLVKVKDCLEQYIAINAGFDKMLIQFDFNA